MRKVLFIIIIFVLGGIGYQKYGQELLNKYLSKKDSKVGNNAEQETVVPLNQAEVSPPSGLASQYSFPSDRELIDSRVSAILVNKPAEIISKIISASQQADISPILVATIIAQVSNGSENFYDGIRSGLMGLSSRHIKLAKKYELGLNTEVNLLEPNQNIAIGVLALKNIFNEPYKTLKDVLIDYLSSEDDLAQDIISASSEQISENIVKQYNSTLQGDVQQQKNSEGQDYLAYSNYLKSINVSISYEKDLFKIISDNLPTGISGENILMLINELSGFNAEKVAGSKIGLLQLTEEDAKKYGFFSTELIEPITNIKVGLIKLKEIAESPEASPKKIILKFLLGEDKFQEMVKSQSSLDENTLAIINKLFVSDPTTLPSPEVVEDVKVQNIPTENTSVTTDYSVAIKKYGVVDAAANTLNQLILSKATLYSLDSDLIFAFIATESGFKQDVVSENNKVGLLQLSETQLPVLAKLVDKEIGDLKNPEYNLDLGLALFNFYKDTFLGKTELALAAHQLGAKEVYRLLSNQESFPDNVNEFIQKVIAKSMKIKGELIPAESASPAITSVEPTTQVQDSVPTSNEADKVDSLIVEITPDVTSAQIQAKKFKDMYSLVAELLPKITTKGIPGDMGDKLVRATEANGVDPLLLLAIIKEISDFDYEFVDLVQQKYGLLKLDPVKGEKIANYSQASFGGVSSLKDMDYNLRLASKFISMLSKEFPNDDKKVVASFFWGPGKVRAGKELTPELEKQINNILANYQEYKKYSLDN